jgi:hypothetical protein
VKEVRITLCNFGNYQFFIGKSSELLQHRRNTKLTQVKVTVENRPIRAGATPLFCGQAAQKFGGVAPALDAPCVALFSTVENQSKQSFMHALLNFAFRKGETVWQF